MSDLLGLLLALEKLGIGPLGEISTLVGLADWLGDLQGIGSLLLLELLKSERLGGLWLSSYKRCTT